MADSAIDFKDRHKGERCFVIGNGPSLTAEILDRLMDEYTFAVNRIAKIFDRTDWRPTYYVGITDALYDGRHSKDILQGIHSAKAAFCWDHYRDKPEVTSKGNVVFVHCSHAEDAPAGRAQDDWWSDDIAVRLDKFGVAVYSALQVAAYMGFEAIYLVGCDGNYKKPADGKDLSHFDNAYRPFDVVPNYDYEELNRALQRTHEIAEAASKRSGFKIYNCSPMSAITAHEKIDLESVL
jgi:hypothetical protein